jgi:hypothetical protein
MAYVYERAICYQYNFPGFYEATDNKLDVLGRFDCQTD